MATAEECKSPVGLRLGKRFQVGKYIAGGSFGRLYLGKNVDTNEEVAIKMEPKKASKPQLVFEFAFFKKLRADGKERHKGIPKIHYFGPCGDWHCLVMDLLGPSLEQIHTICGERFSLKTTALLAIQLMNIFDYFHGRGLIYRDTKPENFLFGRTGTDNYNVVHIIDLGLSKEYLDDNGKHIPFVEGKGTIGTVRYMSLNNNLGHEVSRRDDLEAVAYMLIYFHKGELPWIGVKANTTKEKYNQIARIKEKTRPEQLCADLPKEFVLFLKGVKGLQFDEKPKYSEYITLFNKMLERHGLSNDSVYDFDKNHRSLKN